MLGSNSLVSRLDTFFVEVVVLEVVLKLFVSSKGHDFELLFSPIVH